MTQLSRGRTAVTALLVALTLAAGAVGCAQPGTNPNPPADPPGAGVIGTGDAPDGGLSVDVVVGDRLLRAGGGEIPLADLVSCELCRVAGAWRVPDGWLVDVYQTGGAAGDSSTLWRVSESGAAAKVLTGTGGLLVSGGTAGRSGVQVAWIADGRLRVASYADGAVDEVGSTPAPEVEVEPVGDLGETRPLWPQAFVADGVLLAGTLTGGGLDFWDVWFPDAGDFVPEQYPTISLHGISADGRRIIADYPRYPGTESKETCLGELDVEEFTPTRSVCPSPVSLSARIDPSPDGRWWLVRDVDGVTLYDAAAVWSGGDPAGSREAADGGWIDDASFVVLDGSGVTTVGTDGSAGETVPLPAAERAPLLVADLREGG